MILIIINNKSDNEITNCNSFKLDKEPDLVFSSPLDRHLFVCIGNELRAYDNVGTYTKYSLDHTIRKACVCRELYYIDDKQDLYKLDLETEKEEKLLNNVVDVSVSGYLGGAVTTDGKLYLWGKKVSQYLNVGDTSVPTEYKSDVHWKNIEFSNPHILALDDAGNVYESNTRTETVTTLKKVEGLGDITTIYSWTYGNIAVSKNGYMHYWIDCFNSSSKSPAIDDPNEIEKALNEIKPSSFMSGARYAVAFADNYAYVIGCNGESKENKGMNNSRNFILDETISEFDYTYCGFSDLYLRKGLEIKVVKK